MDLYKSPPDATNRGIGEGRGRVGAGEPWLKRGGEIEDI